MNQVYYRGAEGKCATIKILAAVIVYDCTNAESFKRVPLWVTEVRKYVEKEIPILIAGNKVDLITEKKDQLRKEAELFAK